jgi:hypothetical protein
MVAHMPTWRTVGVAMVVVARAIPVVMVSVGASRCMVEEMAHRSNAMEGGHHDLMQRVDLMTYCSVRSASRQATGHPSAGIGSMKTMSQKSATSMLTSP